MTGVVTSPRNPTVRSVRALRRTRERRRRGRTLLEGPGLLTSALAAGVRPELVLRLPDDVATARRVAAARLDELVLAPEVMQATAPTVHPRGPLAVVVIPPSLPLDHGPWLVPWGVADPGNVGSLVRTAAAFGFGVAIGPGCADPWAPKVLRAAAGGHFAAPLAEVAEVDELVDLGVTPVAAVPRGGRPPDELPGVATPAVLVGSEAHGLPPEVVAGAELRVTIPVRGVESLNAAVAGAIVAYLLRPAGERDGASDG